MSPSIRRMSRLLVRPPRFARSVEVCGEHSSDTPIASERLPRRYCPLRPPSGQPPRLRRRWRRSSRAIFESAEQSCLGPRPARRQPDGLGLGNYRIKVGEDLLHDLRLLDARPHHRPGRSQCRFRRPVSGVAPSSSKRGVRPMSAHPYPLLQHAELLGPALPVSPARGVCCSPSLSAWP